MAANDIHQAIAKIRDGIAAATEKLQWLDNAPLPKEEAKAWASAWVKGQAVDGPGVAVRAFTAYDTRERAHAVGEFFVAQGRVPILNGHTADLAVSSTPMGPLLACLLGEEEMTQRLHARIDALDYAAGPPAPQRQQQRAEAAMDLWRLEVEEEALVCRAEEASIHIGRRENADPAVVLGYEQSGTMRDLGRRLFRATPRVAGAPVPSPAGAPSAASLSSMPPAPPPAPAPAPGASRASGPGRFGRWG